MNPAQILHSFRDGSGSAVLHFQVMNRCRVQVVLGSVVAYTMVALVVGVLVVAKAQQYDGSALATPRLDRLTSDVADLRVGMATLNAQYNAVREEMASLRAGQNEIGKQINAALWGVVSLLGAIVFGLLGVMWSIRKGWLSPVVVAPDRYPSQHAS